MDGSYRIVSMLYIKKENPAYSTYYFITWKTVSKKIEYIKKRIAGFGAFKEEVGMNEMICNKIQTSI